MRRLFTFFFFLTACLSVWAIPVDSLYAHWDDLRGERVTISTPLYLCGTVYGAVLLSPERLYVPNEHAVGLAEGDSTEYFRLQAYNRAHLIRVEAPYEWSKFRLGATITGLEARVDSAGVLSTGKSLRFSNPPVDRAPKRHPGQVRVCGANIENFFVHLGGYASKRTTPKQYELQRKKIATALVKLDADVYALCELEKGESAPAALVEEMNRLCHHQRYDYVRTGVQDGDTISVGFIYRSDRIQPYGPLRFAYNQPHEIYGCRFMLQGFMEIASGERFVLSLNHLRSKRLSAARTMQDVALARMNNIDSVLTCIRTAVEENVYEDADFLLMGDYNCYSAEAPLQALLQAGYEDMLMRYTPTGYSYVYKSEMGYLDRVFASPTMAAQVIAAQPVHWNTDYPYSWSFYTRYKQGKKGSQLPFRYSDHDPILVTLDLH